MSQNRLAFVIAGAQKSGTTTLDAILRLHAQIQMASLKETHFFDDEERDWTSPDYGALDGLFSALDGRLRGEATPVTMYWRPAIRRLHEYNPDVQIVLILRDPVTRAYSNWRHEYYHGRETMSFANAIRDGRRRVFSDSNSEGLHRFFSYVERGFYGEQLSYLLKYFPKENIHCEISEEFFEDRAAGLQRIADFLGVGGFPPETPNICLNPAPKVFYPSDLSHEDISYLSGMFDGEIERVEEFLGRRICGWRLQARETLLVPNGISVTP